MSRNSLLLGFDYRPEFQRTVERPRREWQELMAKTIAAGGLRRVEKGETFIVAKGGKVLAEIYSNVPEPIQRSETT
jgi:hypothetical protein